MTNREGLIKTVSKIFMQLSNIYDNAQFIELFIIHSSPIESTYSLSNYRDAILRIRIKKRSIIYAQMLNNNWVWSFMYEKCPNSAHFVPWNCKENSRLNYDKIQCIGVFFIFGSPMHKILIIEMWDEITVSSCHVVGTYANTSFRAHAMRQFVRCIAFGLARL